MSNQYNTESFIVVADKPERIFTRGSVFDRQAMAFTLWTASWPDGLTVRDTVNNCRYRVRRYTTRRGDEVFEHQRLESLEGYVWLCPTYNGHLKRRYAPARYVVSEKSAHYPRVYHVTRNEHRTLCGWRFNGVAVLREPPEGMRECWNCFNSSWRLVQ